MDVIETSTFLVLRLNYSEQNKINIIAADGLGPSVTRSSAAMWLIVGNVGILVFRGVNFTNMQHRNAGIILWYNIVSHWLGAHTKWSQRMMGNLIIFFSFSQKIQNDRGYARQPTIRAWDIVSYLMKWLIKGHLSKNNLGQFQMNDTEYTMMWWGIQVYILVIH